MPQNFLTRHHDGLRDHRHIVMLTSGFDRERLRLVVALILAVFIVVSALPSSSRADRVAGTAGADRGPLAVQQSANSEPGTNLQRALPSYSRVNSNLEGAREKSGARLRFSERSGDSSFPKYTRATLREHVGAGLGVRPRVPNAVGDATNSSRAGVTKEGRPHIKPISTDVATTLTARRTGLFGSTPRLIAVTPKAFPIAPKVFSITSSPDLFTKPHAGGFKQIQANGLGRSVNVGTFSYTPSDLPIISSNYLAIASSIKMSNSAPIASPPTVSAGGGNSANDSESEATIQHPDNPKGKAKAKNAITAEAKVTIKGEGRGSPNVNFEDGRELSVGPQEANSTPPRVAASADFDSDGVADLVTADSNGTLRFYRGNVDSIYPNSPQAKQRRAGGTFVDSPFYPSEKSFSLGTVPDFLEAGDFNADGKKDVLALSKGDSRLQLHWGDGRGNFSAPVTVSFTGKATALAVGEIGRRDGQTDVAVAIQTEKGSQLLVFENPEGAFKHKPEVFALPSAATDLSIGHLDKDYYGDVAIASGNNLTIVHGRGQAYPLDLKADLNIKRPAALKQTRQFAFDISALAIGRFTGSRGDSLAILAPEGSIYTLDPQREATEATIKPTPEQLQRTKKLSFAPADAESSVRTLAGLKVDSPRTEQEADQSGQLMFDSSVPQRDREKLIREKLERSRADFAKLSPIERDRITAEGVRKTEESNQKRKEGFERSLSSRPIPLATFKVGALISDARLVNAARSISTRKLITARVSDSGKDDLILVDSIGKQIQIVAQVRDKNQTARTELISLDSEVSPLAVVPMRLNSDALSDLVVLRDSSPVPSVLITSPANTFVVNTTDDNSGGVCDGSGPCALRRAMTLANQFDGPDVITFNIGGGGLQTIHPLSELPDLTGTVTIDGTTQPGFAGTPIIEIKGDLLSGANDGVSLKTSNSVIRGLVVNEMPFSDNGDSSVTGGEGIVIFTTSSFPTASNNFVEGNFLGTDPTGMLDKGNQATGVSIFDADSNTIGGTAPQARNILSGNGDYENTTIRGVGLSITGGNNNLIQGNYIGTNAAGTLKLSNTYGVFFTGIDNQFGGDEVGAGNLVSGNGTVPDPDFGRCAGVGIAVDALVALDTGEIVTNNNMFKGNLIGTTFNGAAPLGNCETGIRSVANLNTFIGSITQNGRNTISDNGHDGIWCAFTLSFFFPLAGECTIVGNNIGTDITGNVAIPNDQRNGCQGFCILTNTVWISPSPIDFALVGSPGGTTPGGECTGFCNLISGNYNLNFGGGGVYRSGYGFALVVNNYFGVNRAGTAALPNFTGFTSYYGSFAFGGPMIDGSGGLIDGGNLASGNDQHGIGATAIEPGGTFEIKGNLVGTSVDGINGIPNGIGGGIASGISAGTQPGTRIQIGGSNPLERNVVAATVSDGAGTRGKGITLTTYGQATVINNYIGVNKFGAPLGNSGSGIDAAGDGLAQIGGTGPNEGNLIKNNGKSGVSVSRFTGPFSGVVPARRVIIRGNSIFSNGGLGIDLGDLVQPQFDPDGVPNPNDCFDEDEGGNDFQNYPELLAPVFNGNGTVTVEGTLRSRPASNFIIDFYSNTAADPSDFGEGETHLGSLTVFTDGNGFVAFTFTSPGAVSASQKITATAMDFFGNTSEFSCYAGQCTTGTLPQAIERAAAGCVQPIIVTVNTNESDPNTADGVCDVDTNTSGLQCSLRAAIQEANARHGTDVINFNIPGAGIQTILIPIAEQLPDITEKVYIYASSQPGFVDSPVIEVRGEVNGTNIPGAGFRIRTSGVTIEGFAINRFGINVSIDNANDSTIDNNFIGMNADGLTFDPAVASPFGISVNGNSKNNTIGGPLYGNVIGNCVTGLALAGGGVQNNKVINNKIGTNKVGSQRIGDVFGVVIGNGASNNRIGGELDADTNLISGNFGDGIGISGNATLNRISGNLIGTNINGDMALPNDRSGINIIEGAFQNTIGGSPNERNIISGNGGTTDPDVGFGIQTDSTVHHNQINGNYIGIKKDGSLGLGNVVGIGISGFSNTIGGFPNSPNTISSNRVGISLGTVAATAVSSNIISYNRIGTSPDGNNLSSNDIGIGVIGNVQNTNINNNVISGNAAVGVLLKDGSSNNTVSNNRIGTNLDGTSAVANGVGVVVTRSDNNPITGNQVSGNTGAGVFIGEDFVEPSGATAAVLQKIKSPAGVGDFTEGNMVQNNLIGTNANGTDAIPNGIFGIVIGENARSNLIGGRISEHKGNVISGHTLGSSGYGVFLGATVVTGGEQFPQQNKIQGNRIGIKAFTYDVLPNKKGIHVENATDNFIGPDQTSDCGPNTKDQFACDDFGNIIGGSETDAIHVVGETTSNHIFANNYIGVAPNGTPIGNGGNGIRIDIGSGASSPAIQVQDNTIGNNSGDGVKVQPGSAPQSPQKDRSPLGGTPQVQISGNRIGVFKNGSGQTQPSPNNGSGITLDCVQNILIGRFNAALGQISNIISANRSAGIQVLHSLRNRPTNGADPCPGLGNNVINSSIIGTDESGALSLGNESDGIKIVDSPDNLIGSGGLGNIISGNLGSGVTVEGTDAVRNTLLANKIGVFLNGTDASRVPNGENGVKLSDARQTTIGGVADDESNIIAANTQMGILMNGLNALQNTIKNTQIGIIRALQFRPGISAPGAPGDFGNGSHGILLTNGARLNTIGGPETNAGNTVAFNGGAGVRVDETAGHCNVIDPNSIYGNAGLGIDLGLSGVTPNDPGDADGADSTANRSQNFPEFSSAIINTSGDLVLQYKVDSQPANANYGGAGLYIEFFKADAALQGKTFVGSSHYTVNDFANGVPGVASYNAGNAASLGIVVGDMIVATATDADNNTSEFTGVNVGVVGNPTAVKLTVFSATAHDGSVLLSWQTGFEVDNLGFNVYREVDGARTRITPQLVAGSALTDGPGTSLLSGHSYYWADTPPAGKAVRYWLEDIDLNGKSTFNGAYSISNSPPKSAEEAQKRSEIISQIGLRQGLLENGMGSTPLTRAATLATPSAAAMQLQSALASQPAVKIAVKQEGYYRVTQAELLRAALDSRVDPRLLQLFVDGIEQPIKVTGEQDGRFDASDSVEFYGVGLDGASTDTRVYWLVAGTKPGKRIPITQGKGDPIGPGGFPFTVERKDRTIYFSALKNGDAENFFGAVVASQPVDQALWIQHLDQTAQAGASLEVSLQGVTKLAHNVRVQLNETDVTRLSFTGQSQSRKLVSISQAMLREGENTVRLIAEGGPSDVSLVDVIRISYSHSYAADSDALKLTAQSSRQVSVSGFTRKDIRLMDVTDVGGVQEISATVTEGKNGNTVTGTLAGSGIRAALAFSDSRAKHPWSITTNQPSSLRQPVNGADLLIITQREYFSTVESLKALRQSQGLSVAVADIEDIYDEFSFGNNSPRAVKDFSAYAATTWKKKPRFVLIAGDASYDPKNYLGFGGFDLVPTKLLDTVYMETASDDWFADFDNDGVPELAVGRLPFRNAAEASAMIAKIVGYERSSPSEEVLLVADSNDGFNFEQASAQLRETIPANLRINQINRGTDTAGAKSRLMEAINRGQKLVNYVGHGSVNQWRGNLLVNEDGDQMKNTDHLSVFVMMTCLNGYFDDPALDSLAESLLKTGKGGAVAVWSSSGMTLPADQARMNQGLYRAMFSANGTALLGEAVREAKASTGDVDIRRTWVLLGDPTMRLR